MHWVEVDGFPMPKLVAGEPALDFCNTWAGWGEPPHPKREWLADYDRMAVWSGHAGLLGKDVVASLRRAATRRPQEASRVLTAGRSLRTSLRRALLDPTDRQALAAVSAVVREAGAAGVLRLGNDGEHVHWELPESAGLARPLLAVAHAAGQTLTTADLTKVKACPGDDCGWLFLDSRGRRRWCSMASCGNRAKVRAHAARRR